MAAILCELRGRPAGEPTLFSPPQCCNQEFLDPVQDEEMQATLSFVRLMIKHMFKLVLASGVYFLQLQSPFHVHETEVSSW